MSDNNKTLRQWMDEIAAICPITATIEGGDDSGSIQIQFGDSSEAPINDPDGKYFRKLENLMYNECGYGSFNGEFYVSGSFEYDATTGIFEGGGTDSDIPSDTMKLENPIKVVIPKDLWFDGIYIHGEGYETEFINGINVELKIKDGPVSQQHVDLEKTLQEQIGKEVGDRLLSLEVSINYCYNEWTIERHEFLEEGDNLVGLIKEIDYTYDKETDMTWSIDCNI
jgi:hypothetical protein